MNVGTRVRISEKVVGRAAQEERYRFDDVVAAVVRISSQPDLAPDDLLSC